MSIVGYQRKFQPLLGDFRFRTEPGNLWARFKRRVRILYTIIAMAIGAELSA